VAEVALVTGASRGIGRAIALRFAASGYDVALAARSVRPGDSHERYADGTPFAGSLEECAEEVRARGGKALPVKLDQQDPESVAACVPSVLDAWGRVDVLVNNAIVVLPASETLIADLAPAEVTSLFESNVVAPMVLAQATIAAACAAAREAVIINIGSGAARFEPMVPTGQGGWSFPYAALKAALERLAPLIEIECGADGIRAYTLEPGGVPTDSFKRSFPERGPGGRPLDQLGLVSPEVAGAACVWLAEASNEARALTGQNLDAEALCRKYALLGDQEIRAQL